MANAVIRSNMQHMASMARRNVNPVDYNKRDDNIDYTREHKNIDESDSDSDGDEDHTHKDDYKWYDHTIKKKNKKYKGKHMIGIALIVLAVLAAIVCIILIAITEKTPDGVHPSIFYSISTGILTLVFLIAGMLVYLSG